MIFDKKSGALERLGFCSMSSKENLEERVFSTARLCFSEQKALFEQDGAKVELYPQRVFSKNYINAVSAYFENITHP